MTAKDFLVEQMDKLCQKSPGKHQEEGSNRKRIVDCVRGVGEEWLIERKKTEATNVVI